MDALERFGQHDCYVDIPFQRFCDMYAKQFVRLNVLNDISF